MKSRVMSRDKTRKADILKVKMEVAQNIHAFIDDVIKRIYGIYCLFYCFHEFL